MATTTTAGITTTTATTTVGVMMPGKTLFQQPPHSVQGLGQRPSVDGNLTGLVGWDGMRCNNVTGG